MNVTGNKCFSVNVTGECVTIFRALPMALFFQVENKVAVMLSEFL